MNVELIKNYEKRIRKNMVDIVCGDIWEGQYRDDFCNFDQFCSFVFCLIVLFQLEV